MEYLQARQKTSTTHSHSSSITTYSVLLKMRILTFLLALSPAAVLTQSTFLSHDLYGSAKSFSDQVILNPPMPHTQTGALWAKDKNTLAEWTLTLKFRVNGPEHGGRGMAIWYTTGMTD